MSKDNKLSARVSKRVLILLALDDKKNSNLNHRQIASALNTTVTTIVATARDYFQNGLEHAISHHYNPSSLRPHKVNGELEAHVLQLACGETPDGYSRWTLELFTDDIQCLLLFLQFLFFRTVSSFEAQKYDAGMILWYSKI